MELIILQDDAWMRVLEQMLWTVAMVFGICCFVALCGVAVAGLTSLLSLGGSKGRKISAAQAVAAAPHPS